MKPLKFATILLFIFLSTNAKTQNTNSYLVVLSNKSNLTISGTSNINKFDCILEQNFENDTLSIVTQNLGFNTICENAITTFLINKFNCGHEAINRDFKQALREEEFPAISLSVKNIYKPIRLSSNSESNEITATISLVLAGNKKEYTVGFKDIDTNPQQLCFSGTKNVKMSDFNIDPPKALMGLIKTRDDLSISFDLQLILIKNTKSTVSSNK